MGLDGLDGLDDDNEWMWMSFNTVANSNVDNVFCTFIVVSGTIYQCLGL